MNYLKYFQERPGFYRLIIALKEKYESYGTFNGTIKLKKITEEEKNALASFFGETYHTGSDVTISLKKMNKVIQKSNFENFDYKDLIINYLSLTKLVTKKEEKEAKEEEYQNFLEEMLKDLKNKSLQACLKTQIENKSKISKLLVSKYHKNPSLLKEDVKKIDQLLENVPDYPTTLPIYASITGNPHYLDFNTNTGAFFLTILSSMKEMEGNTPETKWKLLETINVYSDITSNYCITNHLIGNQILEEANKKLGPINLNMDNIRNLKEITGINQQIFIFENPSLLNHFKNWPISMIITSGHPNLAFYMLMEKVTSNTQIYYNGDFDPEGLLIANKLKTLYPKLNLFCYRKKDYTNEIKIEKISTSRLKKLAHIDWLELSEIKKLLEENKLAAYQENNLPNIEEQIKNYIKKTKE